MFQKKFSKTAVTDILQIDYYFDEYLFFSFTLYQFLTHKNYLFDPNELIIFFYGLIV